MAWLQSNLHIVDIQASHQTSNFCLEHTSGTKNVIAIALLWQKLEMSIEGDCNLREALHFACLLSHEGKIYHPITPKKITILSIPPKNTIWSLPQKIPSDHSQKVTISHLYRKHFTLPASYPATVIFSQSRITFLLSRTSPPVSTGFRCPRYWFTLSHNVNITEQTKQQESISKKNPFRRATSGLPIVGHRRTLIMLFTFAREQCRTRCVEIWWVV